jgi:signal transduction histidine kinase
VTEKDKETRLAVASALGAGLVHELRNALAVAESSVFLTKKSLGDRAQAERHLDRAASELRGAQDLVTRVLRYVRGEPLAMADVRLGPLARDVADALRLPPNVELSCSVEPEDLELHAEPALLRAVLVNLLGNAIDALEGRERGHIAVRARCRGDRVTIEVDDDGRGIPDGLVDPFVGLATSKPQGTGLGLVMVRAIAAAHDGSARAERLEHGTRIVVELAKGCCM